MDFFTGDKVIMRKNKVKEYGLVNGDIGRILRKVGVKSLLNLMKTRSNYQQKMLTILN